MVMQTLVAGNMKMILQMWNFLQVPLSILEFRKFVKPY